MTTKIEKPSVRIKNIKKLKPKEIKINKLLKEKKEKIEESKKYPIYEFYDDADYVTDYFFIKHNNNCADIFHRYSPALGRKIKFSNVHGYNCTDLNCYKLDYTDDLNSSWSGFHSNRDETVLNIASYCFLKPDSNTIKEKFPLYNSSWEGIDKNYYFKPMKDFDGLILSDGQRYCCGYNTTLPTIKSKDGNEVLAQFDENTICIRFDIAHGRNINIPDILEIILEQYIAEYPKHYPELAKKYINPDAIGKGDYSYLFVNKMLELNKNVLQSLKQRVQFLENDRKTYLDYLININNDIKEAYFKKRFYEDDTEQLVKKYITEYESIIKNEYCNNIFVGPNELIIDTKTLVTNTLRDKTRRILGRYQIKFVDLNKGQDIHIRNLDKGTRSYPHPHAYNVGESTICWGNFSEHVICLLLEREFGSLFNFIIEFLININEDDRMGVSIQNTRTWPIYNEEK